MAGGSGCLQVAPGWFKGGIIAPGGALDKTPLTVMAAAAIIVMAAAAAATAVAASRLPYYT